MKNSSSCCEEKDGGKGHPLTLIVQVPLQLVIRARNCQFGASLLH